jgi:aldehyde:ferredoxin oxidoreductase
MNAYAGKILRVDLTTGRISSESTTKYNRSWLGGSGLSQWILYNEVKPDTTAYSPDNRLIIGTGPLNGTLAPGASRVSADSKNPLTSGVGSSNADGHFASELKFAGYDHIVFQGKARRPVYLWIHDGRVEIKDAIHLWGKTTWETDEIIKHELGDDNTQVLCIGPAGENISRGACIIVNRGRAFGRCGLGGVMGSKNLKAVAARGRGFIQVADPSRFIRMVDELRKRFNDESLQRLIKTGTAGVIEYKQKMCGIPYKNFQHLVLPDELFKKIDIDDMQDTYRLRNVSYMACPRPCSRYYWMDQGPYADLRTEGFQLEALVDFMGKLAVEDPSFVIKANAYCNQLGLDIDSVAGAIGWAMECYQRGIINVNDTDGLKLEWGDTSVILELIRKIAFREGFGNLLAEGCAHAAKLLGRKSECYAMHIKGQDLYEVIRSAIGWGLGTCVSTRGGGHTTGAPTIETTRTVDPELAAKVYGVTTINDPLAFEGKAKLVWYFERLHRINNALGICHFVTTWSSPILLGFPEIAELYSAATGWETTEEDLKEAAARMLNVEKAFNILHANFGRKDDYPPPRCFEEPIPTGPFAGFKLEKKKWDNLLDEYYELNNWDKKTGFPHRKCLEELGLKEIADDLERAGKIGEDN